MHYLHFLVKLSLIGQQSNARRGPANHRNQRNKHVGLPLVWALWKKNNGVIMTAMSSQIIVVSIVYSTVCYGTDQRKHRSSASLAFVRGIHQWPVGSPNKGPVTRQMFPFDDVIMSGGFRFAYRGALVWPSGAWTSVPLIPAGSGPLRPPISEGSLPRPFWALSRVFVLVQCPPKRYQYTR